MTPTRCRDVINVAFVSEKIFDEQFSRVFYAFWASLSKVTLTILSLLFKGTNKKVTSPKVDEKLFEQEVTLDSFLQTSASGNERFYRNFLAFI